MAKCLHNLFWLLREHSFSSKVLRYDKFLLFLFKAYLIERPRLIYVFVWSLCGVILYFHLTVVSTQLQSLLNIFHSVFSSHLAGESRRLEDKELAEFLWMADFIVTSHELDSFTDC